MNATTDTPRTLAAIDRVYGGSDTPEAVYRNPITDLCRDLERENARLRAALEAAADALAAAHGGVARFDGKTADACRAARAALSGGAS